MLIFLGGQSKCHDVREWELLWFGGRGSHELSCGARQFLKQIQGASNKNFFRLKVLYSNPQHFVKGRFLTLWS